MEYFSDEAWQADRVFDERWQRLYEHFDAALFDRRFSNFEFERDKTTFIVRIANKKLISFMKYGYFWCRAINVLTLYIFNVEIFKMGTDLSETVK